MDKIKRQEAIDQLVDDFSYVLREDTAAMDDVVRTGFIGYEGLTNKELQVEWKTQFNKEVKIVD